MTCKVCAAKFTPRPSAKNPAYCSRSCVGRSKSRENHPMWKGGISTANESARAGAPAKKWRLAVFTRDAYTCQHCQNKGGALHAHHLQPFAKFPELRTEVSNGITLCDGCHGKVHGLIFSNKALNSCADCKKRIKVGAKRCRPCSMAYTQANRPTCPGCGVVVGDKGRRCRSCAAVIRIAKTGHVNFWIKKNA